MPRVKKPKGGEAWEEPPASKRPNWAEVADDLRAHPMEWMKVYSNGLASWKDAIARGHVAALHPDLGFEFTTTNNTRDVPRRLTMYARFDPTKVDTLADIIREGTR